MPATVTATLRQGALGSPGLRETGTRFPVPKDVWPGERVDLYMPHFLPEGADHAAPWFLDVVSEQLFWFAACGTEPPEIQIVRLGA